MLHFREYNERDLKDFGINHLTGESCAISLRILYDLSEEGVRNIEEALCIKLAKNSPANWNNRVGNSKAVKSIKMSHAQAHDVLICILAARYDVVVQFTPKPDNDASFRINTILMAGNTEGYNEYYDQYLLGEEGFVSNNYDARYYCKPTQDRQPHTGLDNQHGFSGRTK